MGEVVTYRDAAVLPAPPAFERSRFTRREEDALVWERELRWLAGASLGLPLTYLAWRIGPFGWVTLGPLAALLLLLLGRSVLRLPHARRPVRTSMEGTLRWGLGGLRFDGEDRVYVLPFGVDEALRGRVKATVIRPLGIVVRWESTVPSAEAKQRELDRRYDTSPAERDALCAGRMPERLRATRRREGWYQIGASLVLVVVCSIALVLDRGSTLATLLLLGLVGVVAAREHFRERTVEVFRATHHPHLGWSGLPAGVLSGGRQRSVSGPLALRPLCPALAAGAELRVCVLQPDAQIVAVELVRELEPFRHPDHEEVAATLRELRAEFR